MNKRIFYHNIEFNGKVVGTTSKYISTNPPTEAALEAELIIKGFKLALQVTDYKTDDPLMSLKHYAQTEDVKEVEEKKLDISKSGSPPTSGRYTTGQTQSQPSNVEYKPLWEPHGY